MDDIIDYERIDATNYSKFDITNIPHNLTSLFVSISKLRVENDDKNFERLYDIFVENDWALNLNEAEPSDIRKIPMLSKKHPRLLYFGFLAHRDIFINGKSRIPIIKKYAKDGVTPTNLIRYVMMFQNIFKV